MCRKLIYLIPFVLVPGLILTNVAEGVDPSLVGWWKFDDGFGTAAIDSSGNGFDITLRNTTWEDGVFGGAVHFHGVGHGHALNFKYSDNAITVCAWVWHDAFRIDKIERYVTVGSEVVVIRKEINGPLHFYIKTDGNLRHLWGSDVLTEGQWHHVAGTWDGLTQRLYIDGVEIASQAPGGVFGDASNVMMSSGGEPFNGMLDEVRIYNRSLTEDEIQVVMQGKEWPFAFSPIPADGALHQDTWVNLRWFAGDTAASHDVYLGENFEDVNDGTGGTFQGNQTATYFIVGSPRSPYLALGVTYYWRIDEVEADGTTIHKGDIWSFTVPPKKAYNPDPADGIDFIDPNVTLSWTADTEAKLHHIYFGDNFDDVNAGTGDMYKGPVAATSYNPGPLELGKVYYWRIDEFYGSATCKGDVWSFTTARAAGGWTYDGGILVGAYYYPWYGPTEHPVSQSLRRHLVPQQTAELGEYDSSSPAVIAKHIDYSHRANIHFWACSWWGPGTYEDNVLKNHILPHRYAGELKYTIIYESTGRLGSFSNPDYSNLVPDFQYFADNYFNNPNYLKIDGRPVVFIYLTRVYFRGTLGYNALAALRAAFPNLYIVADDIFGRNYSSGHARRWDAVTAYDVYGQTLRPYGSTRAALDELERILSKAKTAANSVGVGLIPFATPGFNDKGVRDGHDGAPRYFEDDPSSNEGDLFRSMLRNVVVPKVDPLAENILMVTSFNEWHEDTQIEPTTGTAGTTNVDDSHSGRDYTQGDHYTDYGYLYLDILREETCFLEGDSLAEALDTALNFTTGGSASWFGQATTSYYGGDAAQSGDISHSQDSWMQTMVSGEGTVKFYWKVSSEEDYDFLQFRIDGSMKNRISGSVNWRQKTYTISTPGLHALKWRYMKDGSGDSGSDCGWVDKVEWVTN